MPWATDSRQKLITENPRSFCSSGFVLRYVRCAPVYLKFSAAFYKRRWGRGAKPLGAARRPRNSPAQESAGRGSGGNPRRGFPPPGCAWRQRAVPCSTGRFAETYNRKPGELSLPGFCATLRALRAAHLPPDALFLGSPFKGSCRRSRLRGGGTLRILPKECKLIPPLRPRLRASTSPARQGRLWVSVNSAAQAKPGRAVIRSLSVSSPGSRNIL